MHPRIKSGDSPGRRTVHRRPDLFEAFQPKNTAIVVIAAKGLVPAFSGKENFYIISRELRHVVHGNGRRLTNGFFHVPDISREKFGEIPSGDCHVVMTAVEGFSCQLGIRSFVGNAGISETDRVTADLLVRSFGDIAQYRSRVDASA